jgi:hypothetical protein
MHIKNSLLEMSLFIHRTKRLNDEEKKVAAEIIEQLLEQINDSFIDIEKDSIIDAYTTGWLDRHKSYQGTNFATFKPNQYFSKYNFSAN